MRVVAGEFGGRKLKAVPGNGEVGIEFVWKSFVSLIGISGEVLGEGECLS